jgi:hypothetical protein
MKNIVFVSFFALLLLSGCSRTYMRQDAVRGDVVPYSHLGVTDYELGRAILPGMLGFVGGAIDTDTQRGRFTQQTIFLGATVSIGAWGKRPLKFFLIDFACGMAGAAIGTTVRNQIRR